MAPKKLVGKLPAVTVGASNASTTPAPLKSKGVMTTPFGKVGWRISEDSVDEMLLLVAVHCLNSSCFYIMEKSGAMTLPLRWAGWAVSCVGEGGGGKRSPTK